MIDPHYADAGVTLYHGDCITVMREMPEASVHAIVTDPPYGLEFMGKGWDGADGFRRSLNEADAGRESVFGRTSAKAPEYNTGRGVRVAAERAAELTTKGKGHTTSAGPYLAAGVDSIRVAGLPFQEWCTVWATEAMRVLKPGGYMLAFGGSRTWHRLSVAVEDAGFEIRDSIAWLYGSGFPKSRNLDGEWEGWGTALKPAFEPIVVGRKPLAGTVAANVVEHGTGAIHIAATRVNYLSEDDRASARPQGAATSRVGALAGKSQDEWTGKTTPDTAAPIEESSVTSSPTEPAQAASARSTFTVTESSGRWPTNVLMDKSQADDLDAQTGILTSGLMKARTNRAPRPGGTIYGADKRNIVAGDTYADSGGASRFFPTFHYEAKAPGTERPDVDGVEHPTVKPLELMRWLVRLVASPGAVILEPFAGSGTTLEACLLEGFEVIGIEREDTYLPLIMQRIQKPLQQALFG